MSIEHIVQDEKEYMMHTYGRFNVAIESGKGAVAKDIDGKEYIDFTTGIGVNALGYCDDGWVKAVSEQLNKVQHISNLYYSPTQVECAKQLCTRTGFDKVFFGNSGAEVNECAIKLARKYSFDKYGNDRNEIITLQNSFHGRTVTTLSATGQDVFHNYFFPFTEGFSYVPANDLDALRLSANDKTCAVIMECVQGEGGVNILDKDYVKAVRDFCTEKDILLIIDEVQTGVARTGKLYAFEHYGIVPDVITTAKGLGGGLPIGACLCTEKLKDVLSPSTHGTTFGSNPVVCAGANYVLDIVSKPEFLQEVTDKGEYLKNKLQSVNGIKSVRNLGLMVGIELEKGDAHKIAEKCVENGLLIITAKSLLRMLPPLNITCAQLD